MKNISPLYDIYKKGIYGSTEKKRENLIKIKEIKTVYIFQVVKFNSKENIKNDLNIDNLQLSLPLRVNSNDNTRILWNGPNNWLVITTLPKLMSEINKEIDNRIFALTDLSHSRAIIEIEGKLTFEVIKKGCPINLNDIKKDSCINSTFHGITITIDFIDYDPSKVRFFCLRSFGHSLYESLTDASLEFGYETL